MSRHQAADLEDVRSFSNEVYLEQNITWLWKGEKWPNVQKQKQVSGHLELSNIGRLGGVGLQQKDTKFPLEQ